MLITTTATLWLPYSAQEFDKILELTKANVELVERGLTLETARQAEDQRGSGEPFRKPHVPPGTLGHEKKFSLVI